MATTGFSGDGTDVPEIPLDRVRPAGVTYRGRVSA